MAASPPEQNDRHYVGTTLPSLVLRTLSVMRMACTAPRVQTGQMDLLKIMVLPFEGNNGALNWS